MKNYIKHIIFILSFFCILTAGTDGTIRGQVLDAEGEPVMNRAD